MNHLRDRLKKQGGFTMVELLIVAAIIAILVAVSIPMMNNALERSRHAVDQANIRDAVALASMEYLTADKAEDFKSGKTYTYCVDANHQGYLVEGAPGLGDLAAAAKSACTCADSVGSKALLKVKITSPTAPTDKKPKIEVSWKFTTKTVAGDSIS